MSSFIIALFSTTLYGQSVEGANSREPAAVTSKQDKFERKNAETYSASYNRKLDKKVEEYEARMKMNVKKYAKLEKLMKKPQYTDPSYFGHKKKPKKRPLKRRKLCHECGIVH